jgi:hypothetical protein
MTRPAIRLLAAGIVAVAVLGLLGWLLWPSGTAATTLRGGTALYTVDVTIGQRRIGSTDVAIALAARDDPVPPATMPTISVEAVMPLMGFATPPLPATASGGGRYTVSGVPLMMTGPWELHVSITDHAGADDVVLPFIVTG